MADTYIVDVDVRQLRTRRSQIEQREMSEDEARMLLVQYGFYPRMDGLYLAEEEVLQQLDPTEIIAARPVGVLRH
jgi:hypothetical protein